MLVDIIESNMHIFKNLMQAYEAEFSALTHKIPLDDGSFELDTKIDGKVKGYLWYCTDRPVGFILIDLGDSPFNVCEFYIVPSLRLRRLGEQLFYNVLKVHPGQWQVKQIQGAEQAKAFWRRTIHNYTGGNFTEDSYEDKYWGIVTRQVFQTNPE